MQNLLSSKDYDNYLKNYIHRYIVTSFKGRGRYEKKYFDNMSSAKYYKDHLIRMGERAVVYGISKPPHTILEVNVLMENL